VRRVGKVIKALMDLQASKVMLSLALRAIRAIRVGRVYKVLKDGKVFKV